MAAQKNPFFFLLLFFFFSFSTKELFIFNRQVADRLAPECH
jgi:hypothetical protein